MADYAETLAEALRFAAKRNHNKVPEKAYKTMVILAYEVERQQQLLNMLEAFTRKHGSTSLTAFIEIKNRLTKHDLEKRGK